MHCHIQRPLLCTFPAGMYPTYDPQKGSFLVLLEEHSTPWERNLYSLSLLHHCFFFLFWIFLIQKPKTPFNCDISASAPFLCSLLEMSPLWTTEEQAMPVPRSFSPPAAIRSQDTSPTTAIRVLPPPLHWDGLCEVYKDVHVVKLNGRFPAYVFWDLSASLVKTDHSFLLKTLVLVSRTLCTSLLLGNIEVPS